MTRERLESALAAAVEHLLSEMKPEGFWEGELSSSALSTATAISAMCVARKPRNQAQERAALRHPELVSGSLQRRMQMLNQVQHDESLESEREDISRIGCGVEWLLRTANSDGGWGDTTDSPSNLATTLLATAAMRLAGAEPIEATRRYIAAKAGTTENELVSAIQSVYGSDRTFAVPILANCALAGMVSWDRVPGLPFELAVFPRKLYKMLRLHVVSYALPALIAIGLAIHNHAPTRCLVRRTARWAVTESVLAKLRQIQPESGGFLEATPLTSFVAMSLGSIYGSDEPVVAKCLEFIRRSQRANGSWPIDSNLSVWLTTGAVSALANAGRLNEIDRNKTCQWLAARQYTETHPFTGAAPGGFAWTHLPGGVPDADDTSGAVCASIILGNTKEARDGTDWLLGLHNADGGWPAFCRGWGQLAFDRSSPDITAHAIRALRAFDPEGTDSRRRRAMKRGLLFLANTQQPDGSWIPLWFGNQAADDQVNRVFGTARSLLAYADADSGSEQVRRGVKYLLKVQNADGGWGGGQGIVSSTEETSLAVTALVRFQNDHDASSAATRGVEYLVSRVEDSSWTTPAPIGLYFSSLWYSERLYPVIWAVEALGTAAHSQLSEVDGKKYVCST